MVHKKYTIIIVIIFLFITLGGAAFYWIASRHGGVSSGVEGIIIYEPPCPLEPCSTKPIYDFDIIALRGGNEVGRARPDQNGHYRLILSSGQYQIELSRPPVSGAGNRSFAVQVKPGKFSHQDLILDTGLR